MLDRVALEFPAWARRIRRERTARGWSQGDAVDRLLAHGDRQMPTKQHVLRRWKSWEAGEHLPNDRYQELIAQTFGTVRHAIFPPPTDRQTELLAAASGVDTLEIVTRIKASDVDAAILKALAITVERICSEYAYAPAERLVVEGREWLSRLAQIRTGRLTLAQHREVLALAGWLALLVGCLEYDIGDEQQAESTRRAALGLAIEADHAEIQGWAHEMAAWFALTSGDYRGVIVAAKAGAQVAGPRGVAVQLAAQEAKAWARMGDRREVELALDRGRTLLERLPYPTNATNHFVVDPGKFDYYSMDAYRVLCEDQHAGRLADEVIRAGTNADGTERAPMRCAEARITTRRHFSAQW